MVVPDLPEVTRFLIAHDFHKLVSIVVIRLNDLNSIVKLQLLRDWIQVEYCKRILPRDLQ